jgi:hypothetical protein
MSSIKDGKEPARDAPVPNLAGGVASATRWRALPVVSAARGECRGWGAPPVVSAGGVVGVPCRC